MFKLWVKFVNNNIKYRRINCVSLHTNQLQKSIIYKKGSKINFIHYLKHVFIPTLSTHQIIKSYQLNNSFTPNPQALLLLRLY